MFEDQAKQELFETVKAFHACKQEEGQSVSFYLLKMKSYLDSQELLGYAMPNELGVSLVLNSLNKDYDQFVQNYNMHSMGKTIGKIQKDKKKPWGAKGKDKGKTKFAYAPKPKISSPPKRDKYEDTQRKRWVTTSTIRSRTRSLLLKMLSSLRIVSQYKKQVRVTSARTPPAPDRYGFYVDAEEYELGDLNELPNYKEA
ncbi:hypothetical protein Tco_1567981 [Tanacetum coccineum]